MELRKKTFLFFGPVLDAGAAPEAGADMIVPDMYPDMARIVDASGQACLKDKTLREDRLDLAGLVRVSILYVPEGDGKLKKLDLNIPFNHVFDGHFPAGSEAMAEVKLLSVETRAVNPRKVSVLCALDVRAVVFAPGELALGDEVTAPCEVRRAGCTNYMPIGIKCKYFTVNEDMDIPGTRPPVEDILRATPRLTVTDIKHVGNKIIFKGAATMGLLYMSGGEPYFAEQEFSLSQIIEMENLEDGSHVDLELQMTGMELDIKQSMGTEARTVGISLHLEAQAVAWSERRMEAITDLYSTTSALKLTMESVMLTELVDRGVRRQSVREIVEVGDDVRSVIDTQITLGAATRFDDGVGCEAFVRIIYLTESGDYQALVRKFPILCGGEMEDNTRLRMRVAGELVAAPTSEGIELRFSVDFDYLCTRTTRFMTVGSVQEDEHYVRPVRPSVVMRRCQEGEKLWDIAKAYHTTMNELALANNLSDTETVPGGKLLLIPRKR